MKKYFYGLSYAFGMITFSASATDIYQCGYARADVTNGTMGPMTASIPSHVEVSRDSFKAYRPDGSFIFSPPVTKKQGPAIVADDGAKVYAIANDRSSFAVSDRIKKYTEQWDKCRREPAPGKSDPKDDITVIESLRGQKANNYFLNEKHAFTTNCLVWGDVTLITGKTPAMIIADTVDIGKNAKWDGKEYTFTFNSGSMMVRFTPSKSKHKLLIQAGDKFYGCGPSIIDHSFN